MSRAVLEVARALTRRNARGEVVKNAEQTGKRMVVGNSTCPLSQVVAVRTKVNIQLLELSDGKCDKHMTSYRAAGRS